jgi:hypothetical protein
MSYLIDYITFLVVFYLWTGYQLKVAPTDKELWGEKLE